MGLRVYRYYQDEDGNPVPPPENVYDGMVRDDSGRRTVPFGTSPYSGVELDYGPYDPPGLDSPPPPTQTGFDPGFNRLPQRQGPIPERDNLLARISQERYAEERVPSPNAPVQTGFDPGFNPDLAAPAQGFDRFGRRTVPFGTSPYSGVELDYGPYDPPGPDKGSLISRLANRLAGSISSTTEVDPDFTQADAATEAARSGLANPGRIDAAALVARAGADIAAGRENPGARDGFLDDIVSSVSDGLNYIKERASGVAERTASNYGNVWNDIKEFTGSGSANLGPSLAYNEDTGQFETPGGPAAERVGFGREDSGSWSDTRSEGAAAGGALRNALMQEEPAIFLGRAALGEFMLAKVEEFVGAENWAKTPLGKPVTDEGFVAAIDDASGEAYAQANGLSTGNPNRDAMNAIAAQGSDPNSNSTETPPIVPGQFVRQDGQFRFSGATAPLSRQDEIDLGNEVASARRSALNLVDVDITIAEWQENLFNEESMRDLQSQLVEAVEDGLITVEVYEDAQRALEYNFEEQYLPLIEMQKAMYEELAPSIGWITKVLEAAGVKDSDIPDYTELATMPAIDLEILLGNAVADLDEMIVAQLAEEEEAALKAAEENPDRSDDWPNNKSWGAVLNGWDTLRDEGLVTTSGDGSGNIFHEAEYGEFTEPQHWVDWYSAFFRSVPVVNAPQRAPDGSIQYPNMYEGTSDPVWDPANPSGTLFLDQITIEEDPSARPPVYPDTIRFAERNVNKTKAQTLQLIDAAMRTESPEFDAWSSAVSDETLGIVLNAIYRNAVSTFDSVDAVNRGGVEAIQAMSGGFGLLVDPNYGRRVR